MINLNNEDVSALSNAEMKSYQGGAGASLLLAFAFSASIGIFIGLWILRKRNNHSSK